jgi:hypothetical protein
VIFDGGQLGESTVKATQRLEDNTIFHTPVSLEEQITWRDSVPEGVVVVVGATILEEAPSRDNLTQLS